MVEQLNDTPVGDDSGSQHQQNNRTQQRAVANRLRRSTYRLRRYTRVFQFNAFVGKRCADFESAHAHIERDDSSTKRGEKTLSRVAVQLGTAISIVRDGELISDFAVGTVVAVGAHESRRRLFFVVHDRCADSFYYVLLFLNHESKSSAIGMTYFAHLQDFLHTSGLNGDRQSVSRVEGGNITLAYNEKFAEMQSQIIEHLNKLGLLLNTL